MLKQMKGLLTDWNRLEQIGTVFHGYSLVLPKLTFVIHDWFLGRRLLRN